MRREPLDASRGVIRPLQLLTFLALGLILLLAALRGSRPLVHDDLFWHLATGKHVVEQRAVPTTDLFSFTRNGERWVSHEWGFGLLAYLTWLVGGYPGLVVLKAAVGVAILALLFLLMLARAGSDVNRFGPLLVALLALGLWAIDEQLILRASLLSSLFVVLLLSALRRFDRRGGRLLAGAIAALFLVWGNFHGEVLFGLFVLGLFSVESLLGRWSRRRVLAPATLLQGNPERPYLALFVGSILLTLLNPNGVDVLLYPFRLARFLFAGDVPLEMGHFGGAGPATSPAFYLLVALLLWSLLPFRRARVLSLTDVVSVTAFLVLALLSHRFILYFALFTLPVIARLHHRRPASDTLLARSRLLRVATLAFTIVVVSWATTTAWNRHPKTVVSRHFPAGAVRFLEQQNIRGRLFNHQNYGGYLHWTLGTPVFWDGRNLLFGPLMQEVRQTPLQNVADQWGLDYLLLTEFEWVRLREQLIPSRWGLVYWDDFAAVYLRRQRLFAETLERHELRSLPPFGGAEGLNLLVQEPDRAAAARGELDQILRFEPACQRALYFHGLISYYQGDDERAERELGLALEVGPNGYVYGALARVLHRLGRPEDARRMAAKAAALGVD